MLNNKLSDLRRFKDEVNSPSNLVINKNIQELARRNLKCNILRRKMLRGKLQTIKY